MIDIKKNFDWDNIQAVNFVNLDRKEIEMVRSWRNNSTIRMWMYTDHIIGYKDHLRFIRSLSTDNQNYYWLLKNLQDYYGVVYLNRVNFRYKNAYLGVYANPNRKLRPKAVGKFLIEVLKKIAFDIAKLHTLKLEVFNNNSHAINFYINLGFKKEGILKEFILRNNTWQDVIIMGIINPLS